MVVSEIWNEILAKREEVVRSRALGAVDNGACIRHDVLGIRVRADVARAESGEEVTAVLERVALVVRLAGVFRVYLAAARGA